MSQMLSLDWRLLKLEFGVTQNHSLLKRMLRFSSKSDTIYVDNKKGQNSLEKEMKIGHNWVSWDIIKGIKRVGPAGPSLY